MSEREHAFTVLDWIGAIVTAFAIVGLVSLSAYGGAFRGMYADFGDVALPALTTVVMKPFVPPLLGVVAALPLALAARRAPIRARRLAVVAAFVLACAFAAVCLVGLYMPMFELAGSIAE